MDSDEDSGDEGSSSDEENDMKRPNDINSSSLSDSEPEEKNAEEPEKKPENMPSLKLKIKNLASNNPKNVLESFNFPATENDVDMTG